MPDVVIVGGGLCGLSAAAELARRGVRVKVVERLPAPGGQEPERPLTAHLAREVEEAGAEIVLAALAVSWQGGELATLGINGSITYDADALVVATGTRTATRGELGIVGDRCAGVFPASAAIHLIEAGVLLGECPLIVGGGGMAIHCAAVLRRAGAREITIVAPDGLSAEVEHPGARLFVRWSVSALHGHRRVTAVSVAQDGNEAQLATDAVVLAHRRIPMRNIEGALHDNARVLSCQVTGDPKRAEEAASAGRAVADDVLAVLQASEGVR